MTQNFQNWDDLGSTIQEIVEKAVNSRDYQKLNQTIRQAVDKGTEAVRKAVDVAAPAKTVVEPQKKPVLYGSTGSYTTRGVLEIVGGGILLLLTFAGLAVRTGLELLLGGPGMTLGAVAMTALCCSAGGALVGGGVTTLDRIKRFKAYRRILGEKTHCALAKLSAGVGKNEKFVRKDVQWMTKEGLFLEGHLDREEKNLIVSHETWQLFEQSRRQLEQRQAQEKLEQPKKSGHSPQVQDVLDRGNAFIREIRCCNDRIPGEAISSKIDRMEQIVCRIFARAEAHPEVVPDLKKLMDYYLPMTVKLLNAYAEMDAQSVQGQTIQNSKREIEDTLDTLNRAFEKLLDELFADTALDISSDISVLNTLLAQEGLTEDELTAARKTISEGE